MEKEGETVVTKPKPVKESPLDVERIDLSVTTSEIVSFIHEGRITGRKPVPDPD